MGGSFMVEAARKMRDRVDTVELFVFVVDFLRHARASLVCGAIGLCVTMNTGCSVTGSWERVSVDPPGVPFPLDAVTFDANKN
jgi:hypothetical protein